MDYDQLIRKIMYCAGAVISGLLIEYSTEATVSFLTIRQSVLINLKFTLIYIAAYVSVSLVIFFLKKKNIVNFGWIIIAFGGSLLSAIADEFWYNRNDPDDVFQGTSFLPFGFIHHFFLSLLLMAVIHFIYIFYKYIIKNENTNLIKMR